MPAIHKVLMRLRASDGSSDLNEEDVYNEHVNGLLENDALHGDDNDDDDAGTGAANVPPVPAAAAEAEAEANNMGGDNDDNARRDDRRREAQDNVHAPRPDELRLRRQSSGVVSDDEEAAAAMQLAAAAVGAASSSTSPRRAKTNQVSSLAGRPSPQRRSLLAAEYDSHTGSGSGSGIGEISVAEDEFRLGSVVPLGNDSVGTITSMRLESPRWEVKRNNDGARFWTDLAFCRNAAAAAVAPGAAPPPAPVKAPNPAMPMAKTAESLLEQMGYGTGGTASSAFASGDAHNRYDATTVRPNLQQPSLLIDDSRTTTPLAPPRPIMSMSDTAMAQWRQRTQSQNAAPPPPPPTSANAGAGQAAAAPPMTAGRANVAGLRVGTTIGVWMVDRYMRGTIRQIRAGHQRPYLVAMHDNNEVKGFDLTQERWKLDVTCLKIGTTVLVYRTDQQDYMRGTIKTIRDGHKRPFLVAMENGEVKGLDLTKETWELVASTENDLNQVAVGSRLSVYRKEDDEYNACRVDTVDAQHPEKCFLVYDDGEEEHTDLTQVTWQFASDNTVWAGQEGDKVTAVQSASSAVLPAAAAPPAHFGGNHMMQTAQMDDQHLHVASAAALSSAPAAAANGNVCDDAAMHQTIKHVDSALPHSQALPAAAVPADVTGSSQNSGRTSPARKPGMVLGQGESDLSKVAVGCELEILWPADDGYYHGIVTDIQPDKMRPFQVEFEDTIRVFLNLNKYTWRFRRNRAQPRPTAGATKKSSVDKIVPNGGGGFGAAKAGKQVNPDKATGKLSAKELDDSKMTKPCAAGDGGKDDVDERFRHLDVGSVIKIGQGDQALRCRVAAIDRRRVLPHAILYESGEKDRVNLGNLAWSFTDEPFERLNKRSSSNDPKLTKPFALGNGGKGDVDERFRHLDVGSVIQIGKGDQALRCRVAAIDRRRVLPHAILYESGEKDRVNLGNLAWNFTDEAFDQERLNKRSRRADSGRSASPGDSGFDHFTTKRTTNNSVSAMDTIASSFDDTDNEVEWTEANKGSTAAKKKSASVAKPAPAGLAARIEKVTVGSVLCIFQALGAEFYQYDHCTVIESVDADSAKFLVKYHQNGATEVVDLMGRKWRFKTGPRGQLPVPPTKRSKKAETAKTVAAKGSTTKNSGSSRKLAKIKIGSELVVESASGRGRKCVVVAMGDSRNAGFRVKYTSGKEANLNLAKREWRFKPGRKTIGDASPLQHEPKASNTSGDSPEANGKSTKQTGGSDSAVTLGKSEGVGIGTRLSVWSKEYNRRFTGTVTALRDKKKGWHVEYDADGEKVWVNLQKTSFSVLPPEQSNVAPGGTEEASDTATAEMKETMLPIGTRVDVYWGAEKRYFRGTVTKHRTSTDNCYVVYDDGDVAWVNFDEEEFRQVTGDEALSLPQPARGTGRVGSKRTSDDDDFFVAGNFSAVKEKQRYAETSPPLPKRLKGAPDTPREDDEAYI